MAKASIIVTAHNMESSIDRCLHALAAQSLADIEVIVVDGGSADSTPERITAFAARDPRFVPVLLPGGGAAAVATAANAGLDLATSDWVGFADGSGVVEPDFVQSLLTAATMHDADLAICQYRESVQDGDDTRPAVEAHQWSRLRAGLHVLDAESISTFLLLDAAPWRTLYRRSLLERQRLRFPAADQRAAAVPFHWYTITCARSIAVVPAVLCDHHADIAPVVGDSDLLEIFHQHDVVRSWIDGRGLTEQVGVTLLSWVISQVAWVCDRMPRGLRRDLFQVLRSILSQYDGATIARAMQQADGETRRWCEPLVRGDLARFTTSLDSRPDTSSQLRLGLYHLRHSGVRRTLSLTRQVLRHRFGSTPLGRLTARGAGRVTSSSPSHAELMVAVMVLQQEIHRLDRKLDELILDRRRAVPEPRSVPSGAPGTVPLRRAEPTEWVPASA